MKRFGATGTNFPPHHFKTPNASTTSIQNLMDPLADRDNRSNNPYLRPRMTTHTHQKPKPSRHASVNFMEPTPPDDRRTPRSARRKSTRSGNNSTSGRAERRT